MSDLRGYNFGMCGRAAFAHGLDEVREAFSIADAPGVPALPPRYNAPPSSPAYVVGYNPRARRRGVVVMKWGLVPRWWPGTLKAAPKPANAVCETAGEKPTFRDSFRARRCLVPASGFYEWGPGKVPHHFRPAVPGGLFALGGVWDVWETPEADAGGKLFTFAVLTTRPNGAVGAVHARMPVIVPPADWGAWLDPATPAGVVRGMLAPCDDALIEGYAVSQAVNSVRNDGPGLIEPVASGEFGRGQ